MELFLLIVVVWAAKGAWDHVKTNLGESRDQRVAEVAKTFPKGALPKSRRKAAARQHAAGWWAREVRHGFPVARTGWHAAWLAHQTTADHHKARREEARTTALETRASVLKGMPGHKERQAEAQKELDAIREQLAEWERQVPDVPPRGKRAVREAADEVARKRQERQRPGGTCPSCGAPDGYGHLKGCDPATPPLPADGVRRPEPAVTEAVRVRNAEDSAHLRPGEPRCEGCGATGRNAAGTDACPVCRGWGSAPADPMSPLAAPDAVCTACGNTGRPGDPVLADPAGNIHLSHAEEQQEAYRDRLNRLRNHETYESEAQALRDGFEYEDCENCGQGLDGHTISPDPLGHAHVSCKADENEPGPDSATWSPSSPTTQGAPVTADTNYTTVLTSAKAFAAQADEDAVTAKQRRATAERLAEEMQAAEVDSATLSSAMDLAERLKNAEEAAVQTGEHATALSDGLQRRHGGIKAAVDDAPIDKPAQREFYTEG